MTTFDHGITLRNLRVADHLSQETIAFTAEVWVDGEKVGTARNDGHGGCNFYEGQPYQYWKDMSEWLGANMPPMKSQYFPDGLKYDMDLLIGDLIEAERIKHELAKKMRRSPMFTKKGHRGVFTMTVRRGYTLEQVLNHIRTTKPEAELLNDMPLDRAVTVYQQHNV